MPEINTTALLRRVAIVNAITATARVSALLPPVQPQGSNATLSHAPLTGDQASHLLRHVITAQLREHGQRQLLSPPHAAPSKVRGTPLTDGRLATADALRMLISDSASALARIFPATGNPLVLENARAVLWRAIAQQFFPATSPSTPDDERADHANASRRNSPDWYPFAWTAGPDDARKLNSKRKRKTPRKDESPSDDPEAKQNSSDEVATGRDSEPDLLDIVEWLQRQDSNVDYTSVVTGDDDGTRAGGLLDESV